MSYIIINKVGSKIIATHPFLDVKKNCIFPRFGNFNITLPSIFAGTTFSSSSIALASPLTLYLIPFSVSNISTILCVIGVLPKNLFVDLKVTLSPLVLTKR